MLGTQLTALTDGHPAGLTDALDLVAGVDAALAHGLARVGEADAAALASLAAALGTTPLADLVAEAVDKICAGSVTPEHLAALAGARSALLGAAHDALLGQLDAALGRGRVPWSPAPPAAPSPVLAGARAWLHEVAVTGWRGVDHELVAAAGTPVEAALAAPESRRLAVLLDGLAAELRACVPVAAMPQVPARRWADLWARGVLLAQDAGAVDPVTEVDRVDGRLLPLGVDVHEHDTAMQIQVHAILEPAAGGPPRLVRTAVGAAKVDTIVGPALWRLLQAYPTLLAALAQRRGVTVADLPVRGADLRWQDDRAQLDGPVDPFAAARVLLPGAQAAATAPLDRHPAAIAEPVLLEGYAVGDHDGDLVLELDGRPLAVAVDRLPSCGPLTPELVAASSACLGLLRWDDGRWRLQPLAVRATVKRKAVDVHTGDWACGITDAKVAKAEAKAGDAVAVLRERAGRLLRR
ncbi:hypothetical protein ONA91_19790 [Micromonospora sp. DR5-3]|uniref:hypothetical protein n=1 Tax=unclassified Micromonospora TaxID=2617518 RepID=UPI0011DA61EC|nr:MULTISPECIES: hypothetical protein [unclassified Micromonospora]MCW3816691.1 hypothetical protein [Micromonospora sp. DR5-3]TYC22555.1 hypothetical protein FXF52_20090 [Micromonospora sp. MP36]